MHRSCCARSMLLRIGRPLPCGDHAGMSRAMRDAVSTRTVRLHSRLGLEKTPGPRRLRVDAAQMSSTAQKTKRADPVTVRIGPERRLEVVVTPVTTSSPSQTGLKVKGETPQLSDLSANIWALARLPRPRYSW